MKVFATIKTKVTTINQGRMLRGYSPPPPFADFLRYHLLKKLKKPLPFDRKTHDSPPISRVDLRHWQKL